MSTEKAMMISEGSVRTQQIVDIYKILTIIDGLKYTIDYGKAFTIYFYDLIIDV